MRPLPGLLNEFEHFWKWKGKPDAWLRGRALGIPLVAEHQRVARDFMKPRFALEPARLRGDDGPVKDAECRKYPADGPACERTEPSCRDSP
jgi:hypothetical protein